MDHSDKTFNKCMDKVLMVAFILLQIDEIPKLTSGCTEFIDSAEEILEKRKMNQTLLANHSTLLDLLEIPQLMDTYVFDNVEVSFNFFS